jgi:hypothetical protein
MEDYCNIYYSNDLYSATTGAGAPGSERKIISGRVVVHGIIAYVKGPGLLANVMNQRPIYLSGPDGASASYDADEPGVFKFVFPDFADARVIGNYPFYTGGNGILFEDGVYLGVMANSANDGTGTDTFNTLLVLFTGGALT